MYITDVRLLNPFRWLGILSLFLISCKVHIGSFNNYISYGVWSSVGESKLVLTQNLPINLEWVESLSTSSWDIFIHTYIYIYTYLHTHMNMLFIWTRVTHILNPLFLGPKPAHFFRWNFAGFGDVAVAKASGGGWVWGMERGGIEMRIGHLGLIYCTLQETNISPKNGILKMIFLFPRWDMLMPWRVLFPQNRGSGKWLYLRGNHPIGGIHFWLQWLWKGILIWIYIIRC